MIPNMPSAVRYLAESHAIMAGVSDHPQEPPLESRKPAVVGVTPVLGLTTLWVEIHVDIFIFFSPFVITFSSFFLLTVCPYSWF